MTHRQHLLLTLTLVLSQSACGSVDAGPGEDSPDGGADHRADSGDDDDDTDGPDAGDTGDPGEGPAVVSVSPADGASGVRPGANLKIVFDRAMDTDSVEAAWSSELLPADAVAFSWNPAGDTLTVNPDAALPVAEGDGVDPDVVDPIAVAYSIGTGAEDADGNALAAAFQADFTTVRRMTVELSNHAPLTDSRQSNNAGATAGADVVYAGDTSGNLGVRLLVSFALPVLPGGAELESADLSASQIAATANIFNSLAGDLEAAHVRFSQITSAYGAGSLGNLGIFSGSTANGARSLAVTSAVRDDLEDAVDYSQFRLEFPLATNSDGGYDTIQFSQQSFELAMTYLVD